MSVPHYAKHLGTRFQKDPTFERFLGLVDIIFGLVVANGFVSYSEGFPSSQFFLRTVASVLIFLAIGLSWLGYHTSIKSYPYNKTRWSKVRIVLDFFVLFLYTILTSSIMGATTDSSRILFSLFLVFAVYSIIGKVRRAEWRDTKVAKPWLSLFFALAFLAEWVALNFYQTDPVILLLLAIPLNGGYRSIRSKLGYPRPLFVGVDIDGVLGDQVPPALERAQRDGKGTGLTKEKITSWNYPVDGTNISDIIETALLDPNYVLEMKPIPGAVSALKSMLEEYHVVIATDRPVETEKDTREWLEDNFGFHEFANTRGIGKDTLELDVLIDDNPSNIARAAASGIMGLLFAQPWNREADEELRKYLSEGKIYRCDGWPEVLKRVVDLGDRKTGKKLRLRMPKI